MQKLCIFMQTKGKKCIIKILICLRMQDVDLKNSLHLLWILNIDFVVWVTCKNFSNKANSHRCCHIRLTTQRGLETIYTSGKLNELPPCLFVVWSIVLAECPLTCTCNMAMNHEKGGRHNQFLDKWLKEFGWFQTRGSGDDLLMICKDCTKAGKKKAFTSGWKISKDWRLFVTWVRWITKVRQKCCFSNNIIFNKGYIVLSKVDVFKQTKKTMKPSYLPVSLSHNNNKKNFLGEGHQDFGTHPNCLLPQFDLTCGSEDPDWKILVTSLQWNKITLGSWR